MTENFKKYLQEKNFSENTVKSYVYALRQFAERFPAPAKQNLKKHREWLIAQYCPQTVNLRLRAINCYLESTGRADRKLSFVRMQQKPFAENVISQEDYIYFKNRLREDDEWLWYFVIRFFAATGVRVNELTKLKVEDVRLGHLDIYSKGGKMRRIYMPKALQEETLFWLREICRQSGFLFVNKFGERITARGIAGQLKNLARRYGLDVSVVYPHSFRHRFAKSFLERCNDIAFLADLMGHESIETTRIYLRRTASEQQKIVDKVVNW